MKSSFQNKNNERISSGLSIILIILIIIPIITGFWYIVSFSVNVPFHDQFNSDAPLYISQAESSLSISDIFRLHNDHRPIIPSIFILLNGFLSNSNNLSQVIISYLLYVLAFGILSLIVLQSFPSHKFFLLILIPLSVYFFNWYMLGSLLWGTGIYFSSFIFFLLLSAFCLNKSKNIDIWLFFAVIAALCCMFSFSSGLIIWSLGIIYLLLSKKDQRLLALISWVVAAGFSFFFHFIYLKVHQTGIHGTSGYKSYILTFIEYPLHKTVCYLGVIGSNIIHSPGVSIVFGLFILLVSLCIILINKSDLDIDRTAIWYSLLGYSFLTSLMLTLSRSGDNGVFGPATNLFYIPDIRHFVNTILVLVSLYLIVIHYCLKDRRELIQFDNKSLNITRLDRLSLNCGLTGIMVLLLVFGTIFHLPMGLNYGKDWFIQQNNNVNKFLNYDYLNEMDLKTIHPNPEIVIEIGSLYEKNSLGIFDKCQSQYVESPWLDRIRTIIIDISLPSFDRESHMLSIDIPEETSNIVYWIDNIEKQKNTWKNVILIKGWAFIDGKNASNTTLYITLISEEQKYIFDTNIVSRQDVADHFKLKDLDLDKSGFQANIPFVQIPDGTYQIGLIIVSKNDDDRMSFILTNTYIVKDRNAVIMKKNVEDS